jgi:hypothetical protein
MPERATVLSRSEKSAKAVLVDASRRRAERGEVESGMTIRRAQRQMSTQVERVGIRQGEALSRPVSDEARRPRPEAEATGAGLLKAVLARDNMQQAWKRVRSNKGAAGVDGLSIDETAERLMMWEWPSIREQLLQGTYRPQPVRRVTIPKPDGGERELGIPTVTDRLASVFQRKFLGYSFWVASGGRIHRRVADKAKRTFKQRVRELTRRSGGVSLPAVVEKLRTYVLGWKAYFRLAQTPKVWRELDQWIRHRMRAIQLKQWKRGMTAYRELIARGASKETAQQVARNTRRWWRNSGMLLNAVLDLSWADKLGIPRLS